MVQDNIYQSRWAVFSMSLPIFIETTLQMLVPNINQIMLSWYSDESVAAVGNDNLIFNLIILTSAVLAQAATILIAHYRGAGNGAKIDEVCSVSAFTNLIIGIIISFLLFFGDNFFLNLLDMPKEIYDEASLYLRWIGVFSFIQSIYMSFISFLRGFSLLRITMLCSLFMNIINIMLNMVLINGYGSIPPMGVTGVCISTNISKIIGLALVIYLFYSRTPARLSLSYLKPFPYKTLEKILYLGLPSGGEFFSYQLSQTVIMKFVNIFGVAMITAKVYCSIIAMISYAYSQALAMATQILVGFFKGAKQNEEVDKRVKFTITVAIILSGTIATLVYFNNEKILSLFTENPEILAIGEIIFFIEIFLEMGRAVNMCMVMALNAAGDVKAPITVGIIFMWCVAVPGAWLLGVHLAWGLVGIWIAMACDECLRALIFLVRWHQGVWKKNLI